MFPPEIQHKYSSANKTYCNCNLVSPNPNLLYRLLILVMIEVVVLVFRIQVVLLSIRQTSTQKPKYLQTTSPVNLPHKNYIINLTFWRPCFFSIFFVDSLVLQNNAPAKNLTYIQFFQTYSKYSAPYPPVPLFFSWVLWKAS